MLEAIIAIALFALLVSAMVSIGTGGFVGIDRGGDQTEAESLAQEGLEAVRAIRDDAWRRLAFSTSSVAVSAGGWIFSGEGTTETVGDFTRTISLRDVCRDGSNNLTACPGSFVDLHTKEIVVTVTWQTSTGIVNSIERSMYLSNWQSRDWTQTDWSGGSGFTTWSDATPTRYNLNDGGIDHATAGQFSIASVPSGGSIGRWIPGGGTSVTHTSASHFNAGTFASTTVSGSGNAALVQLATQVQWSTFIPTSESGDPRGLNDLEFGSDLVVSEFGYAVGKNGTIMKWDGASWGAQTSGTTQELHGVSIMDSADVWAVGDNGTIMHWNGFSWSSVQSASVKSLLDVFLTSETDGWIVGAGGDIQRWNGAIWTAFISPTSRNMYSLDFVTVNDGWSVGANGEIMRWNGTSWSVVVSPTTQALNDVHLYDASNGWAVGNNGAILRWNGTIWTSQTAPDNTELFGVYAVSATEAWATGNSGTLIHTTNSGATWSLVSVATSDPLRDIYMISASNGQFVGGSPTVPTIFQYDGVNWTDISGVLNNDAIYDISMISSSDGWASGNAGLILHWNGNDWLSVTSPTNSDLQTIDMVDASNGFAAGQNGKIVHYNGSSWSLQTSGVSATLLGSSAVSASTAWIVGNSGTILKTINSGSTWSAQTSPVGSSLRSVYAVDTSNAWAVGAAGVILSTSNGGTTWTQRTSGTTNTLNGVHFVDTSNGWAVGNNGTIRKTNNAGVTWTTVTSGTTNDLLAVYFTSISDGWAVGVNSVLLHWNGVSWTTVTSPVSEDMHTVAMVNGSDVWAAGQSSVFIHYGLSYYLSGTFTSSVIDSGDVSASWDFIKWTENINAGWTDITVDTRTGNTSTPDATWSAFVGGYTDPLGDPIISPDSRYIQYRVSFTTIDSQQTSTLSDLTIDYNNPTTQDLYGVEMLSASSGFASGGARTVFEYDGVAWSEQTSGAAVIMRDVDFVTSSTGWAVGDGGVIIKTTNGGSSFSTQTSGTALNLNGVAFVDANNGWAVGNTGAIRATVNGGSTWSGQTSGTTANLQDVFFVSTTEGWAVGAAGTILHTVNGGSTWSSQTSGTTNGLNDLFFTGSTTGWTVGNGGVIRQTTNGGSTWVARTSQTTNNLYGLGFFGTNNGWAVGAAGTIMRYAGIDWALFTSPVTVDLQDVSFSTATDGWGVGAGGLFIHFTINEVATPYLTSGVLTSSGFDMGDTQAAVNTLDWDELIPSCSPVCTVRFQLSTAPDSGGVPGTFSSWYGAAGINTYFTHATSGVAVPTSLPTNRWVRYRTLLDSDGSATPTVYEMRLNYQ